ncbi:hypothetical protein CASFOL_035434 [Castilleja foliolosa]|uniref:Uncharacterized protein n=1 Tax=Castilleja foliolosa TaxID=1961234 RepID=A0ABD3BUY4_9LAMI
MFEFKLLVKHYLLALGIGHTINRLGLMTGPAPDKSRAQSELKIKRAQIKFKMKKKAQLYTKLNLGPAQMGFHTDCLVWLMTRANSVNESELEFVDL